MSIYLPSVYPPIYLSPPCNELAPQGTDKFGLWGDHLKYFNIPIIINNVHETDKYKNILISHEAVQCLNTYKQLSFS